MIPVLIALGLVVGRWWRAAIVIGGVGALGWSLIMYAAGRGPWWTVPVVAVLGLANTALGALVHQAGLRAVRAARSGGGHPRPT